MARSAGGETTHAEHIKTCGRGVLALRTRPKPSVTQIAEPCGVCVSMCRAAVALSLALAPARRVWFAAGRAGSRTAAAPATDDVTVLLKIDQSHAGTARQGSTLSCPPRTPPR